MVTYAQLESESWYRNEVVTEQMEWLITALCKFFGVPRNNGGCKGDNRHLNGGHRGQNWILHSQFCTNHTYSVELLLPTVNMNDLAAFDITLPDKHMYTISKNADRATRAGQLEELVEWFGNINGDQIVDGWDNIKNKLASSDSSHLWHFHGRILRSLLRSWATVYKIYEALTGQTLADHLRETGMQQLRVRAKDSQQVWVCDGITRVKETSTTNNNSNNHHPNLLGPLGNGGNVYAWDGLEKDMDYWGRDILGVVEAAVGAITKLVEGLPTTSPVVGTLKLDVTGSLTATPGA